MKVFVAVLVLACMANSQQGKCHCEKVSKSETTHWGSQKVVLGGETTVREIHGQVLDSIDHPMTGALVEVFNDPDVLLMKSGPDRQERERNQARIAACNTAQDGRFCFARLRPGRYELRCSKRGYDAPQMIVVVGSKNHRGSTKDITVTLSVSR